MDLANKRKGWYYNMKIVKDYMDRDLELPNQDQFTEIMCSKCGDTISYSTEDTSLNTTICETCMGEIYPDDENTEEASG